MNEDKKTITVIRDGMGTKVSYKVTPIDVNCGESAHMPNKIADKELLEKAAKAAEIALQLDDDGLLLWVGVGFLLPYSSKVWNPLTDDGDALRLASACGLYIDTSYNSGVAVGSSLFSCEDFWEPACEDICAATRRAITRAAAAMVKE